MKEIEQIKIDLGHIRRKKGMSRAAINELLVDLLHAIEKLNLRIQELEKKEEK